MWIFKVFPDCGDEDLCLLILLDMTLVAQLLLCDFLENPASEASFIS